ncbi:MAG TPA: DUF3105 domain-containing protein [Solirubrobacteraceae bacterium]|nr:DUF3105 domain-containing protein [Solirubrobacteraceae bacterium]
MAHRQEEKEQRKRERLEREAAAAAEAKRKRMLQIVGGVVVAAAVVIGLVLALTGGGGDEDRPADDAVTTAARAANCTYKTFPEEGNAHVADKRTKADYKTNPPTSGDHNPTAAQDGLYQSGNEPALENWVHTLEHGRIILMYKPGTPPPAVTSMDNLFKEPVLDSGASYHMVLMRNNTQMPFQAAAVAWRRYVGCPTVTPAALEAMRTFRDRWVDKGPEFIP